MNRTYWAVRYKAKGRVKAMPIVTTLRATRTASIMAAIRNSGKSWKQMREKYDLEYVKVNLIDEQQQYIKAVRSGK
jgi:hypothetical protein